MRDKPLVIESLNQLEQVIENLLESTSAMQDMSALPKSADGMLRLNGICMCFIITEKRHFATS